MRAGNVNHKNRTCFHCAIIGYIKVNCPDRIKGSKVPWKDASKDRKQPHNIQEHLGMKDKTH